MADDNSLYNETNDVANMESFIDVYTPSIVWNRSYLIPKRDDWNKDAGNRRFDLKEVKAEIDGSILDFLQSDAGLHFEVDPSIDGNIILFEGAFERQTVHKGRGATTTEIQSLGTLARRIFAADERAIVLRGEYSNKRGSYKLSIKIHARTNLFTLSMIATPVKRRGDMAVLSDAGDFAYFTSYFWDELAKRIMTGFPDRRGAAQVKLRAIFADSRGLIISSHSIPASKTANDVFKADVCWAEPVIRHLAPILSPADKRSCTATYMLDKRAITLTTFGSQPTPQLSEPQPLTFVICVHGDVLGQHEDGWARHMGHVMSRSHTITTMRLAALIDLRLLRAASVQLAEVEDKKALARELISKYEEDEIEGGEAHQAVDALRKYLAQINSAFLESNAAGVGLTFRIESSRYYIEEFNKHVKTLGLSSIDGYQSYAQTIDRNVDIIFEFISRLGARYDRLVSEARSIEQSFSTVQMRHTGNLIAELQTNGEFILISFLVPYYLINIVAHVFGAPEKFDKDEASSWRMINAAIWMACLFFEIYRYTIAKYKPTMLRKDTERFKFAVQLSTIFLIVTMLLCLLVR